MNDIQGWKIFWKALKISNYGDLSQAAEWMYKLNVLARSMGQHVHYEDRHPIIDQIYSLKDELIKYLYQSGYATEVRESLQERKCRTCGGSGEYWTGEMCYRCYGSGVYAITKLYAFRFCIDGKPYAWHQLQKLVDYPVTLTDEVQEPFRKPPTQVDDEYIKMKDAWLGVCVVWWALLRHGTVADLLLFSQVKAFYHRTKMGIARLFRSMKWWNQEMLTKVLIALIALVMVLGCVFWHPILYWIWCNIFQRCVDGVAF